MTITRNSGPDTAETARAALQCIAVYFTPRYITSLSP